MVWIISGAYEGHIIGYEVSAKSVLRQQKVAPPPPKFALKAHDGCVKAVASGGHWLATCGTDHAINVYNLKRLRMQGKLLQQAGGSQLHCLAFYSDSHLVAGGGDGELCIWRSSDWECLLRMKGHKGAVHAVAIHPSGRAALSVAADSKLMLWNLTTGKCNYTTALSEPARLVCWSPDGERYAYETRKAVHVYALRSSSLLHTLPHDGSPALAIAFATDDVLLTGDDAGSLRVWCLTSGACLHTESHAHRQRVKCIATFGAPATSADEAVAEGSADDGGEQSTAAPSCIGFSSSSTDGTISTWRLTLPSPVEARPMGKKAKASKGKAKGGEGGDGDSAGGSLRLEKMMTAATRLRLTTLCASDPAAASKVKLAALEAQVSTQKEGAPKGGAKAKASADESEDDDDDDEEEEEEEDDDEEEGEEEEDDDEEEDVDGSGGVDENEEDDEEDEEEEEEEEEDDDDDDEDDDEVVVAPKKRPSAAPPSAKKRKEAAPPAPKGKAKQMKRK